MKESVIAGVEGGIFFSFVGDETEKGKKKVKDGIGR
jgi:hypothetical protein